MLSFKYNISKNISQKDVMKNNDWFLISLVSAGLFWTLTASAEPESKDVVAKTSQGDQVVLHANGRWEFIDTKKAIEAKEIALQFPENQGCPSGMQGGFLGLGRCIPVGDKEYNRGSMTGKGR